MSNAAKLIITNGLDGPACCGMIVTKFSLAGCICKVTTVTNGVTGGSIPLRPGQIHDFYRPVKPENQPYYTPVKETVPKEYLKVTVKLNKTTTEKEFMVPKESLKGKLTVKIIKFIERQTNLINVVVKELKDITNTISVKVKSFTKRDK